MGIHLDPKGIQLESKTQAGLPWDAETTVENNVLPAFECHGCGYLWSPKTDKPANCPNCSRTISYDQSDDLNGTMDELIENMFSQRLESDSDPDAESTSESMSESEQTETDRPEGPETDPWT